MGDLGVGFPKMGLDSKTEAHCRVMKIPPTPFLEFAESEWVTKKPALLRMRSG